MPRSRAQQSELRVEEPVEETVAEESAEEPVATISKPAVREFVVKIARITHEPEGRTHQAWSEGEIIVEEGLDDFPFEEFLSLGYIAPKE